MTTPSRTEAAAALLASLRELDSVLIRLQAAAAWVLDTYGDLEDAETVRMLRVPGGPDRPSRPPVPPVDSVTGDETQLCECGHRHSRHDGREGECAERGCGCAGFVGAWGSPIRGDQ